MADYIDTGKPPDHVNRYWQCNCCKPPRQIYAVEWRWGTSVYHEDDHSPATRDE